MKRKVVKQGQSTLMVSLPSKWVKKQGVKQGDEIELNEDGPQITLSRKEIKINEKKIELDISKFNKFMLSRYLEVLYITNYQKITLIYTKDKIYNQKIHKEEGIREVINKLSNRFIGMEIVSQTNNMTELRCFIIGDSKDTNQIEKRVFFLIKEAFDECLASLESKEKYKEFYKTVYDTHDNITKFLIYYLRILDQSESSELEKKMYFSLYWLVDSYIDKFRHVNEMILTLGYSKVVKEILKEFFELLEDFFKSLHKGEFTLEIINKRYRLVEKYQSKKLTLNEFRVVSELESFLLGMNDFARAIIAQKLTKIS